MTRAILTNKILEGEQLISNVNKLEKIKSHFKNQKCRKYQQKKYQVVHNEYINNPGSSKGGQLTDKYTQKSNLIVFKKQSSENLCQIKRGIFLPKNSRLREQTCMTQTIIFNQISYFNYSLATKKVEDDENEKTLYKMLKNDFKLDLMLDIITNMSTQFNNDAKDVFSYQYPSGKMKILLSGDVELNPGPEKQSEHTMELKVVTYNARGLKDKLKLKRLLNVCSNTLKENPNTFILLQETHLDISECENLNLLWRQGVCYSPGVGRQWGTMILYGDSWSVKKCDKDENGRFCSVLVTKSEQTFAVNNIYAPNDHNLDFFTYIYDKIYDQKIEYPEAKVILGGDFNLVLGQEDSVNRSTSNAEKRSRKFILEQNQLLGLKDSFRINNQKGGYTWSRQNCMSRLDLILLSVETTTLGVKSKIDWGFDVSDHAMLETTFKVKSTVSKGKGLYRVNTKVLENNVTLDEVKRELTFQLSHIPAHWNPHQKLDYVKMSIRSTIGFITGKQAKREESDKKAIVNQLNLLRQFKETSLTNNYMSGTNIEELDGAIVQLEMEYQAYLDEKAKFLIRRSGAKWYEEGERSNSYFLNLISKREEQTLISRLDSENGLLTDQTEIADHIVSFYQELYSEKTTSDNFDDLFAEVPQLSNDDRRTIDQPVTLEELKTTLTECDESAPGPDGISYLIYKKLWTEVGEYLLNAWIYSNEIGCLPEDQRVSCITLLPKAGKDLNRIENWRPITLTNCDLKIFTKLIANRVSKILDKIISPAQTAYIPGRVVQDNLRVFDFYKNYCKTHNVDGLLISLDAKKAFDSVSHKYLHETLRRYGFSNIFIETVQLLYKDIKASIMVNGFRTVMINIARSVKQGDALSCALFIICIDPLIRKMESNRAIESVPVVRSEYSNISIKGKVGAFADDVGLVVRNNPSTIKAIFDDYSLFSSLSGIQLNLEKTEILKLNLNSNMNRFVPVNIRIGSNIIKSVEHIKICGIVFSNNENIEYKENIKDKIFNLEKQMIRWLPRHLSLEGKITIVKTFGLSQLIYSLQMCEIKEPEVKQVEGIIFKFLWNKKWNGNQAPDRIKRSYLKNSYENGGLKVPDIKHLDMALKTRQFIRAMKSNHQINLVQKYALERQGYFEFFKIEYAKLCKLDPVTKIYQQSANYLTDVIRNGGIDGLLQSDEFNQNRTNIIASTDVLEYFTRKKTPLIIYRFKALADHGIETLHELFNESRFPRSDRLQTIANEVLSFFPREWIDNVANAQEIDSEERYEESFFTGNWILTNRNFVTVKKLREVFASKSNVKVEPYKINSKFELDNAVLMEHNPFLLARSALHAPRDRFYRYRILHGDIFCNQRAFKFKMVESQACQFCHEQIETIKHVLWECQRASEVWSYLKVLTKDYVGEDYLSYNTVVLGNPKPVMAMEVMIIWSIKMIMSIDRRQLIPNVALKSKFETLFYYEKTTFGLNSKKMATRWGSLINKFIEI
jgi:exonuclease III